MTYYISINSNLEIEDQETDKNIITEVLNPSGLDESEDEDTELENKE